MGKRQINEAEITGETGGRIEPGCDDNRGVLFYGEVSSLPPSLR